MSRSSVSPIVSLKVLCSVVGACVIGAFVFVPDQAEFVARLDKDGDVTRLKEVTQRAREEQLGVLSQSDVQRMRGWMCSPDLHAQDHVIEEIRIMCAVTDTPLEVGNELIKDATKMGDETFAIYMEALARRALGIEHPADAGWLLSQLNHRNPGWELTMRAVQDWRWAVRPDEALKTLEQAVADGLKKQDCPEPLDALRIKLALESNQPNYAFDIVYKQYQEAPLRERPALMRQVVEMANTGDRTAEAGRIVAEYLATVPFHAMRMEEAAKAAQAGPVFAHAEDEATYKEYATLLARWQEWGNHGDEAFDIWLHVALLGSDEAWERVQDLCSDLERQEDLVELLTFRINKGLSLDKIQMLADLLAEAGRLDEAVEQYQKAIPSLADPLPAHRWLARVYQELGRWDESIAEFGIVLKSLPEDAEAVRGQAFALVRLHRYEEACDLYVKVARLQPEDADLQETCAGLCASLGRNDETSEATKRLIACPTRPSTPEDYMELADDYRLSGHEAEFIATLRTALKHYPDTVRIRITLAEALGQGGRHEEAVQLLAQERLRINGEAMDLLINEALDAQDASVAARFFGQTLPACLHDLPVTAMKLASLFDHLSQPEAANSIVTGLLHDARFRQNDTWMILGGMCLESGDEARAESFVTLYLSASGAGNSKAWELLGDIYRSQDRGQEALAAYSKAVEVVRGPAAQPPERGSVKVSQRTPVSLPISR